MVRFENSNDLYYVLTVLCGDENLTGGIRRAQKYLLGKHAKDVKRTFVQYVPYVMEVSPFGVI